MIAFSLGGFHIYWYGIFYFVAFLLGYAFLYFVGKKGYFSRFVGLQSLLTKNLEYLLFALLLGVLIGGRLGHIFIYQFSYYVDHFSKVFAVWEGGMSFIGGILGVVLAVIVIKLIYKLSWKEWFLLFDLILVVVPLGIFFGRLGNFLNQELYGVVFTNPLGWGQTFLSFLEDTNFLHIYKSVDSSLRINTNLLSMIFEGIFIFIINLVLFVRMVSKKMFKISLISGAFVSLYAVFRFLFEYLRVDSQMEFIGWFTKSQWFFLFFTLFGVSLFFLALRNKAEALTYDT